MSRQHSTEHFIQEKASIQDPERTATFAMRQGTLAPQPFDPGAQSLLLIGLPGSGRGPLASALADRLDMLVALLGCEGQERCEDLQLAAGKAMRALNGAGRVYVVDDRIVPYFDAQALSCLPLTPVYLIADVPTCLAALAGTSHPEAAAAATLDREQLASRLGALEPSAMTLARHLVRADLPLEAKVARLLDRLGVEAQQGDEEGDLGSYDDND
ncbi:hypothetical protein [Megalodesulfovibrio paquesii]